MNQTITRKFLIKRSPKLVNSEKTVYERYYLFITDDTVIRVQKVGNKYEIERKANKDNLVRESQKIEITAKEFDQLAKQSDKKIVRDSYKISSNPDVYLRLYREDFEGLIRAEVNFNTKEEADSFIPPGWFGIEITGTPLSQDGNLLRISRKEFKNLLEN